MASINGVELRNVKTIEGMEYTGFSGTLYLNGKKIGSVRDSGDGGDACIGVAPDARESFMRAFYAFKGYLRKTAGDKYAQNYSLDTFVLVVVELAEAEKILRKSRNKKFLVMAFNLAYGEYTYSLQADEKKAALMLTSVVNEYKKGSNTAQDKEAYVAKVFATKADFDLVCGTDADAQAEIHLANEAKAKAIAEYRKQKQERLRTQQEMMSKLTNFAFTEKDSMIEITDKRTGKSVTVGQFAISAVKEVLAALNL